MNNLKKGDVVKLTDNWKTLREQSSYNQREFYAKLAHPNKHYVVEQVTTLREIYLEGETQYFKESLLELI